MKTGDIVRCVNPVALDRSIFRIVDVQTLFTRALREYAATVYDIGDGNGLDYTADELEPLTVSDLFREAGFPIPEGARLITCAYRDSGRISWHWIIPGKEAADWENAWICEWLDPGDDSWWQYPDLSRLPAADAWPCLPEPIKAVAEHGTLDACRVGEQPALATQRIKDPECSENGGEERS